MNAALVRTPQDTIPRLLRRNALHIADRPAIREKNFGIWRTLTWTEYYATVLDIARGLAALGFKRGDALAIIGDNRPMLYATLLAAQCLGGRPVPLYQDAIAAELEYVLEHANISMVIAEDQEQVDKMLALRERLPGIKDIVFSDRRGMFQYRHEGLRSLADVVALGRAWEAKNPGAIEAEIDAGCADDIALICYTSGTTGRPKGAMLSHGNLIAAATAFVANTDLRESDDWIAFLPSRTHPGLGVPNRYLGRFADGTTKVRGIEVRRSDVPTLVERTQARMLEILFGVTTLAEVRAAVPRVLDILTDVIVRLRNGEVRAADLAITTTLSRTPEDYRNNAAVAVD